MRAALARSELTHFRTQARDEMLDVQRKRRAAFHRDIGVEPGRLDNPQQFHAGIAAMRDRELIDHRNAEPGLDQRTDRGSETRPDGDVVGEFICLLYTSPSP